VLRAKTVLRASTVLWAKTGKREKLEIWGSPDSLVLPAPPDYREYPALPVPPDYRD
jgi:hypothetical protein